MKDSFFYYSQNNKTINDIFVKHPTMNDIACKYEFFTQFDLSLKSLPRQGWKIHISCYYDNYQEILNIVSDYCFTNEVTFKYIHNKKMLFSLLEKSASRFSAGKFITIYPANELDFKKILNSLYKKLNMFNGPYILTDKRYLDAKVIYYRYGLINPQNDSNQGFLISPNNDKIKDLKECYYFQPDFIESPFTEETIQEPEYLSKRYSVESAININNSGGIYIALSNKDNKKVILKEARPYVGVSEELTSIFFRKNEKSILELMSSSPYTPNIIDDFFEWEHYYIVIEYIEGITFSDYSASAGPAVIQKENIRELINCYKEIKKIFINILKAVIEFHNSGVVLGDISADNIIINNTNVTFIDLEDAQKIHENPKFNAKTIGFYNEEIDALNFIEQDKQKLGYLFLNMFSNSNKLLYLDRSGEMTNRIFQSFAFEYQVPRIFVKIINMLIKAKDIELEYVLKLLENDSLKVIYDGYIKKEIQPCLTDEINTLKQTIKYHYDKQGRAIYPINSPEKNNYSLLYGAPLISLMGGINESEESHIKNQILKVNDISLANGISGYLFYKSLGSQFIDIESYIEKIDSEISNLSDITIRNGLCGIAITYLHIYIKSQDKSFLSKAIALENKIKELVMFELKNDLRGINLGLLDGLTGVAYFYTYLYECTSDTQYLILSETLIEKILSHTKYIFKGTTLPIQLNSNVCSPYLANGGAGLVKTIIRYLNHSVTNKDVFEKHLLSLLDGIDSKFVSNPSYFYGLAGIGDAFLDAYHYFNNESYLIKAYDIFRSMQLFKIPFQKNYYYPGVDLMNLGLDFEKGLAGILYFYIKLNQKINSNNSSVLQKILC
ncbi:lanthionine synthetase LanC family protein [Bacillus thuringiensis]|uniref:class III lanthionine synthetase LanKC N-terminal domain-containing protein n=1 Tax=Bacillus thuringiensis TaxID=1428 RepID=UPI00366DD36A